uniref:Uncharacterized protein n=1 Tax=Peronospora matthiolae TaxID=2874970 RepID=A0AAV1TMA9_9STRA
MQGVLYNPPLVHVVALGFKCAASDASVEGTNERDDEQSLRAGQRRCPTKGASHTELARLLRNT